MCCLYIYVYKARFNDSPQGGGDCRLSHLLMFFYLFSDYYDIISDCLFVHFSFVCLSLFLLFNYFAPHLAFILIINANFLIPLF